MIYKDSLTILKICNNKISTLEQIYKLKDMENMLKLDLSGNEVCKVADYRKKVFENLKGLQCLDGKDQDDQSVESDSDVDEDYGEENEAEQIEIP